MPYKVLLAVDGSDSSLRAARYLAGVAGKFKDLEVHLANVQPPGDDWTVRRLFKPEEFAKMEHKWGEAVLRPEHQILMDAGVNCIDHIEQGEIAPTIVRLAGELGCNQIVMGTGGHTALGDLLLGATSVKVLHLAAIPVTLVK